MENIRIVSPQNTGEKERIKRIQKKGLKAKFTDFAASLKGLYNWTLQVPLEYTKSQDVQVAIENDNNYISFINDYVGIRPVIDYDKIASSCYDAEDLGDGVTREKYGEYPKSKVTVDELIHICTKARQNLFKPTGKRYTIHERQYRQNPIYIPTCKPSPLKRRSDIKVVSLREFIDDEGNKFVKYNNSWYKVEPVTLLVDRENNIAVTEDVIYSSLTYETFNLRRYQLDKPKMPTYEELEEFLQEDALENLLLEQTRSLKGFINNVLLKDLIPSEVDLKELFRENGLINGELDITIPPRPVRPQYPTNPWYPKYPEYPQYPIDPWYPNPLKPYVRSTGDIPIPEEDIPLLLKK